MEAGFLKDCHPGHGCFACPYHDCIRAVSKHMTADERRMRQAGYEKKPRMASAKHPVRGCHSIWWASMAGTA